MWNPICYPKFEPRVRYSGLSSTKAPSMPVGVVLEVPAEGWDDDELENVKSSINNAKGRIFFGEAMKTGDRNLDPVNSWT